MPSNGADDAFGIEPVAILSGFVVLQPVTASAMQIRIAVRAADECEMDERFEGVFAAVIMVSSIRCLGEGNEKWRISHEAINC